jgi:hypothetical protein
LVRFFSKIPLQPQNFVHQFEFYYQVVGFLVVLGYRLEDQLCLTVEVVMLTFIQFLPPFLAAGLGKSGKDRLTEAAGLVIHDKQIEGWCDTFLLQNCTKPLESNFFDYVSFF